MFGLLRDESAAAEAHQHYLMQALAATVYRNRQFR
jgi:hypothetical protein